MTKIRIVTDSTADIPSNLVDLLQIKVVPLQVIFGQAVYQDGIDISPKEFYNRLREEKTLATTSQPSPGQFASVYQELVENGCQVISIHISQGLSGTFQSASLARDMLSEGDVEVIDSKSASMGLGLIVLAAAKAAEEGRTKNEILSLVNDLVKRVKLYFAVDTLKYLEQGGRIGKAQALLGSLLNIKPVCTLEDGIVVPVGKARGMGKALDSIVDIVRGIVPEGEQIKCCLIHGDDLTNVMKLHEKLINLYSSTELLINQAGPVIGAHTGPGVIGIAFYGEKQ